jgi:hypothetical protein
MFCILHSAFCVLHSPFRAFCIRVLRVAGVLLLFASAVLAGPDFVEHASRTRIDYQSGLVYHEDWVEGYYNGVTKVESLDTYLSGLSQTTLTHSWQEAIQKEQLSEDLAFDRDGLIPEINLPKLPLFGTGSKIDIAGQDRITLGGSNTVYPQAPSTAGNSAFLPELKMEQALKINLNGTIGDKTKIFLDHDSERQFESKNKIRLSYEGTEDEIIQSVEAGDTRLVIPSTGYTGDLPAHNGLFGVSARGKLGGVDVYGVAAREQSETQTQEFHQQKQIHLDTIRDFEFVRYTRFRLDTVPLPEIRDLHVYVDDGNVYNNQSTVRCIGTVFPDQPDSIPRNWDYDRKGGDFDLKRPNSDYVVSTDNRYIEFVQPAMDNYAIGVTYKMVNGPETTLVGGYKWHDSLVVKLIKAASSDTASRTWDLEFKNMYSLGTKDVKIDSIWLYRRLPGQTEAVAIDSNGVPFLHLAGFDPDVRNTVVWPRFDASSGYLISDSLHPFINGSLAVPDSIYRLRYPTSYNDWKYFFKIYYSTSKESYNLGVTDILENSEKVIVDGVAWTKDVDYKINYVTGEVTLTRALAANAVVNITYEYTPFFSMAEKTVVGTRAEWKFLDNGKLGSSVFYRTEDIPGEDKPSLGAEPFQRMVAETDFGYDASSDFITGLLDRLPLVRAEAPTSFHIGGEGAVSLPNPNTRNAAYLDDFEGSTVSRDMGNAYRLWQACSVPVGESLESFATTRLTWFNPVNRILKESIFGTGIGDAAKDPVQFLRVWFMPDNVKSWAGLMTCPSRLGINVSDQENVEAVLRTRRNSGVIHVTLGTSIDEDAPRRRRDGAVAGLNGYEDTEDKNHNGVLDEVNGEDSGLDTIPGTDGQNVPGDDGNDDYNAKDPEKDASANPDGTEGDKVLDGEDMMGSGWTRSNHYYEYTFRLDDTVAVKPLFNGWKTLRIALKDPDRSKVVGGPRLEEIRLVRVWFDSFPGGDTIDIYSLAVVGSKWRNPRVESLPAGTPVDTLAERVRASLISKQTDPNYTSPFQPQKDALGKTVLEASLKLAYEGVQPGHRGIVRKTNPEQDDYRDYREMYAYVHEDVAQTNPDFFLQIGSDSANYYEFRQTISKATPDAGYPGWYEFRINLDTLALIKYQNRSARGDTTLLRLDAISIAGNPTLSDMRYMAMGIENTSTEALTGEIWIDDIRLTGPRKDVGLGFNTSAGVRLSDLANFNISYRYEDPNFRRFSEGRGVKTGGYSHTVGYGIDANLERFFPASWSLSLPFNYSYSSARTIPKFSSLYPDMRLPAALSDSETGKSLSSSWSISARKNRSTNRLLNYTLEAMSYSFRHSTGMAKSMLDSGSTASNYHSLDYSVSPDLKFKIGETEISYFPQSIHLSGNLSDSRSPRVHRDSAGANWINIPSDSSRAAGYDFGLEYSPVTDLSFDYSLTADRDLTVSDANRVFGIPIGQESGRDGTFGASYNIDIGTLLSPKVDFQGHYTEDRLRFESHYSDSINVQNGGNIDLSTDFDLPEALAALGKLRDESKDSSAKSGTPQWILVQLEKSSDVLSPIDLSYTFDRSSSYNDIGRRPPWWYQFGFNDALDTTFQPSVITRQMGTEFNASTDFRIKIVEARLRYSTNWDRDVSGYSPTGNISTTWPDISLSLSKVEALFPKLLTSSSISSGYQLRTDFTGTYSAGTDTFEHINQRYTSATSFSPLLSWQATWKNKITTTFSTNYTKSQNVDSLDVGQASTSSSENRSYSFNLGYSFSAPSGIKLFGLRKLKFTSDLSVNFGLTYGRAVTANAPLQGQVSYSDNNEDIGSTLALSYRFSRSIEAGLNTGYSVHRNLQYINSSTRTTNLNFWVLFKF